MPTCCRIGTSVGAFPDAERQGKTLVPFAEQKENKVATVFVDFPLVVLGLVVVLVPVNK